ncbi:MAG: hypothetical protein ACUZ8H_05340 [Candidatus Anammoxibacter sp.]
MTDMSKELWVQRAKCTVTNEVSYSCDPEQILVDDTKYTRANRVKVLEDALEELSGEGEVWRNCPDLSYDEWVEYRAKQALEKS